MQLVVKYCPVIQRWNCCCCSCELRTAALCLGWILMVFSTIKLLVLAIKLSNLADVEASSDVLGADTSLEFESKEWNIVYLIVNTVSVLLYGVLQFGVQNKKPFYMLPSLVFEIICIIISVILNIVFSYLIVVSEGFHGLIFITIIVLMTAVKVFVWIVLYSCYRQLEDETETVSVYRVVNCTYQNVNEHETVQNSVDPTDFFSTANNALQKIAL